MSEHEALTPPQVPLAFPTPRTSVPDTLPGCQRYAVRLELRFRADQRHALEALRHLDIASDALRACLKEYCPWVQVNLAVALGEVQVAQEALRS